MKGQRIVLPLLVALGAVQWAAACGDDGVEPEPNRAPEAVNAISDVELDWGDTTAVDAAAYFSDPDGDELSYEAATSEEGVATVSVSGSVVTVEAAGKGVATVTVTASDPDGLSDQQSFMVTVPNRAPEAADSIPGVEPAAGETAAVDVSAYFTDPDGDSLSYKAATSDEAVATVSVSGSVVTVEAAGKGSAAVTVTASDPEGLSARQSFMVTVPNRAPEAADSIPGVEPAAGETAAVEVSAYFTDPDGDALSYEAATSDSAVATVSVSGSVVTVGALAKGGATVTVTASDPDGLSARRSFAVTVPNRAPEAADSIPGVEPAAGETAAVEVSAYFTDPDGDALSYEAATSDSAVATVSVSGSVVTVEAVGKGRAAVTVMASDPEGLSARRSFAVTVAPNPRWAALVTLFDATGGPSWTKRDNWRTEAPLGEWFGVGVDGEGRVVSLLLPRNNLTGPVPPEVAALSGLSHLDLRRNALTGSIAASFLRLHRLEAFQFGSNDGLCAPGTPGFEAWSRTIRRPTISHPKAPPSTTGRCSSTNSSPTTSTSTSCSSSGAT